MIFKKIQDRILNLLPKRHQIDKSILLEDCCSEISRLVASWIKESNRSARFYILKGDKVCKTKKSHDVLAVVIRDGEVYLIHQRKSMGGSPWMKVSTYLLLISGKVKSWNTNVNLMQYITPDII